MRPGETVEIARERPIEDLPLCLARTAPQTTGPWHRTSCCAELEQTGAALGLEEQAEHSITELVARRPLHRPARVERLVGGEDLLDEDDLGRSPCVEPVTQAHQIRPRVGQTVDVVDAQSGHGAMLS